MNQKSKKIKSEVSFNNQVVFTNSLQIDTWNFLIKQKARAVYILKSDEIDKNIIKDYSNINLITPRQLAKKIGSREINIIFINSGFGTLVEFKSFRDICSILFKTQQLEDIKIIMSQGKGVGKTAVTSQKLENEKRIVYMDLIEFYLKGIIKWLGLVKESYGEPKFSQFKLFDIYKKSFSLA